MIMIRMIGMQFHRSRARCSRMLPGSGGTWRGPPTRPLMCTHSHSVVHCKVEPTWAQRSSRLPRRVRGAQVQSHGGRTLRNLRCWLCGCQPQPDYEQLRATLAKVSHAAGSTSARRGHATRQFESDLKDLENRRSIIFILACGKVFGQTNSHPTIAASNYGADPPLGRPRCR